MSQRHKDAGDFIWQQCSSIVPPTKGGSKTTGGVTYRIHINSFLLETPSAACAAPPLIGRTIYVLYTFDDYQKRDAFLRPLLITIHCSPFTDYDLHPSLLYAIIFNHDEKVTWLHINNGSVQCQLCNVFYRKEQVFRSTSP